MPKEIKPADSEKFLKCPSGRKYYFIDTTGMSTQDICNLANEKDQQVREKAIFDRSIHDFTSEDTLKQAEMTFWEEFTAVCLFLFGVPGAAYTIPVITVALYYLAGPTLMMGYLTFLVVLSMLPAPFREDSLWSYPAIAISKYFSFKGCFTQMLDRNRPYILVAPPHGLFPFGNLVTMIAFPCLAGFSFKGLAASAALRMPYFRQLLCTIGVIDASAKSATKALKDGYTIGISTGGVAEVFETNSATGDEAIVLRERKGLVKLAIRTGAPLVPSYLFGNTKLFSQYTGGDVGSPVHSFLEQLSRKIGFATVLFWGRFLLPIPYRIPIMGCMGPPIEVVQSDDPTPEYVDEILAKLVDEMEILFNDLKEPYGWKEKKLLIK